MRARYFVRLKKVKKNAYKVTNCTKLFFIIGIKPQTDCARPDSDEKLILPTPGGP